MGTTLIMCPTAERLQTWCCIGDSRESAEKNYREALASGNYDWPLYRVVARRKPSELDHSPSGESRRSKLGGP